MSFRGRSTAARSRNAGPIDSSEWESAGHSPVTGVVNRIKVPNTTERRIVESDRSIETVMLPIECARRLVKLHSETANTYFRDDQTIITTTTTHDETLKKLDWNAELEIIRRFSPDYHIPTDYSVYQSMTESEQAQAIDNCLEGTEWITTRLKNHSTTVLLQAKGWLPRHYERCESTLKRLHKDFVVFYAAGYKARVHELNEDIKTLVSVLNPTGILLIGKQSTRFLRQTIPEVVAAAGGRWRRQSGLYDNEHSSQSHMEWKQDVEQYLGSGQATIDSYTTSRVKENG